MKIEAVNDLFGLTHRIYPFIDEAAELRGHELSFDVHKDHGILVGGQFVSIEVAEKYLNGIAKAIEIAKENNNVN